MKNMNKKDKMDPSSGKMSDNPRGHMKNESGAHKSPGEVNKQKTKKFGHVNQREEKK